MTPYHDIQITHLERDTLECEVKWTLGAIATNKGDGIPGQQMPGSYYPLAIFISCADLDYCGEWFALKSNRDHSVILEIAPKYYILNSSIDCEGYSISSTGFLLTVVEIMVI